MKEAIKSITKQKHVIGMVIQLTICIIAFLTLFNIWNYYRVKNNIFNKVVNMDKILVLTMRSKATGKSSDEKMQNAIRGVEAICNLKDEGKIKDIRIVDTEPHSMKIAGEFYPFFSISKEYFNALDIKIDEGRSLNDKDFNYDKHYEEIPIVVGSYYKGKINIGDTTFIESNVKLSDRDRYYKKVFKVVGIAKPGTMVMFKNDSIVLDFQINDYGIYAPLTTSVSKQVLKDKNSDKLKPSSSYYSRGEVDGDKLYYYTNEYKNALICRNFQVIVNDKDNTDNIREMLNKIGKDNGSNLSFIKLKDDNSDVISLFNQGFIGAILFSIVALIFSVLGISYTSIHSLSERRKEFGIRLSQGATVNKIISLIFKENLIKLVIAIILSTTPYCIIKRIIYNSNHLNTDYFYSLGNDGVIIFISIFIVAASMLISMIPTFLKIKSFNVVDLVRGKK